MPSVKIVTLSNLERYVANIRANMPSSEANSIPSEDIGGNIWLDEGD